MRRPTFSIHIYNNAAGVPAKLTNNSPYAALNANIVKLVNTHTRENLLDLQGSANLGQNTRKQDTTKQTKGANTRNFSGISILGVTFALRPVTLVESHIGASGNDDW